MKISMTARKALAGRVGRQFDKYVEYMFPVPFDPVLDVYRHYYTDKQWIALRYLMQEKSDTINSRKSFDLYHRYKGETRHVTFPFPEGMVLPGINIQVSQLPEAAQALVEPWLKSVSYMRELRAELIDRCNALMGNPGNWRRMEDLDPCCNTPGQVIRIWPEIQPFLEQEHRSIVRQAAAKSKLPEMIGGYGTPEEFQCKKWNSNPDARRRFEELSEILVKISLLTDLHHVAGYPTFSH